MARLKGFSLIVMTGLCRLAAQSPPSQAFQANAVIGAPQMVGYETFVSGSRERIETGTLREVTLNSAELALAFPNRVENIIAGAGEKLLILRGTIRNPEKTASCSLGASQVVGLRLWQRYTGTGKFSHVAHFDPDTLRHISKQLKFGESARFIGVWRVPADFGDFRLGLSYLRPVQVAWYDLGQAIGKLPSVFATPDGLGAKDAAAVTAGQAFDLDGLELRVDGVRQPAMLQGIAADPAKRRWVVAISATNRMLLPARWGWQYFTTELVAADGSLIRAYPDILEENTERSWAGDLPAGAATRGLFQFYGDPAKTPRALRLKSNATARSVDIVF